MEFIKQGTFKIIRTDGSEEFFNEKPTFPRVLKEIGADCIDTVTLDRNASQIMVVDDTGMIDGKPVNAKATALYLSICKPGTNYAICGDVILVNDRDFS